MCGIACYLGKNKEEGKRFGENAGALLRHRGPDDYGLFVDDHVTLAHTRLSILELSALGHQPMVSSCGRYIIIYNGEIYNHLELRKKYLNQHHFRGSSDTETILELFRLKQEQMVDELVGMWAFIVYDKQTAAIFVSRSRFGQKPLYVRRHNGAWYLSSEIKPLIFSNEEMHYDPTALTEYLALGNYGHLGTHTFFKNIFHFSEGSHAWIRESDTEIKSKKYWELPEIKEKDKRPFDKVASKELHDRIVQAVISQTLSDVPIGITLSGGVDSSIIAGILASYYNKEIHIFTAQSVNSKYDETKYVDAVIEKFGKNKFIVHSKNLKELTLSDNLEKYVKIQQEPFGDPSIIAHGFLMEMAANANIKVILGGQGADELFFGYNNMIRIILSRQLNKFEFANFVDNISVLKLGNKFLVKTLLGFIFPTIAFNLRIRSRIKRREFIRPDLMRDIDNDVINIYKYDSIINVLRESFYGVHIPHLVQYDDRNAMAYSVEGRMPFLDHRIAEYVATIKPEEFLKHGMRKYILRKSCQQYLPDSVFNRKDKIGFYTPLVRALYNDKDWVLKHFGNNNLLKDNQNLINLLNVEKLDTNDALVLWKCLSIQLWMKNFNVAI